MRFIADLQLHSKHSRATSPKMVVPELARWAKIKGIKVIGTGDFTHPMWLRELQTELRPAEPGLYVWKDDPQPKTASRFMLTAETSHIYSRGGRGRRVHLLIWAPSFAAVEKINRRLGAIGNLKSDGRPIIGLDCRDLVKIVMDADPECLVIPAHAWTPWFSVFGSMSGFDSLEECFGELTPQIRAIETGLSSDPAMNWRLSQLDRVAIVSNSDSHSLERLGREANVFAGELSYRGVTEAVKSRDPQKFLSTIEFFPEEGKYHYDGHRACGVRLAPAETKKLTAGRCPKCGRPVTVGVMSRVEALADRPEGFRPPGALPYKNLVPLDEIIAETLGVESKTKKVKEIYFFLTGPLGGELPLLLDAPLEDIEALGGERVAEGVRRVRAGELQIAPGYDGEYGKIKIFSEEEKNAVGTAQTSLF